MKKLLTFVIMTAVAALFAACSDSEEKKLPEAPAEATPRAEAASASAPWTDSMEEAVSRAKEENKVIFALFTAPEWCGFCRILEEKVLSKDNFTEKASEFAVLLMLDYSDPDKLPAAQKEALLKLQRQYRVFGPRADHRNIPGDVKDVVPVRPGKAVDADVLPPCQLLRGQGDLLRALQAVVAGQPAVFTGAAISLPSLSV